MNFFFITRMRLPWLIDHRTSTWFPVKRPAYNTAAKFQKYLEPIRAGP